MSLSKRISIAENTCRRNFSTQDIRSNSGRIQCRYIHWLVLVLIAMNRAAAAMSTQKKGALIFLHGLGDTPAGWSSLEQTLPSMRPKLQDIAYVFPPAPTIPISINGGRAMPGWFDLYDWPIAVGSQDDPEGLQRSVSMVQNAVKKLNEQGIPSSKIVVGGFSQGGAVSLLYCYQQKEQSLAGCAALSAWLTLPDQLAVSAKAKSTPLFWGHGRMDDKVLFDQQAFGIAKLEEQGIKVDGKAYNMGHSSHPQEMEDLADFLEECLFPDGAESASEL
ncbi:carboxylesterase [Nitzschia inconspicua]|uniref:Carboxylesterase n=1 Tax=Nitzschia inconspicua TaxID=303405 RepID=A0A9K3KN65_9STRA|nr:carboxylesterase [Nitzschia inconspicua]